MHWKATVFLLVATVAVGAYISFYELRQPLPEEREQLAQQILSVPSDAITQLALDLPAAKVMLTKTGASWTISPEGFRANESLISAIVEELSPFIAERILEPAPDKPLDLKAYGLDPAGGWLTIVTKGKPTTLLFGETTPIGANRYLKVSTRPEVFIIASRLFDAANQPTASFRDPLLLALRHWSVDALTITSASGTTALTRTDNEWRLTQPLTDRAQRSEVNTLLNRLGRLPIKRFVDDAPKLEQPGAFGFDAPSLSVTLSQSQPAASLTLVFGSALPDDASLLYAKRSDEPSLYAVAASDVEALRLTPHQLRATACFEFFTTAVKQVRVAQGSAEWTIERHEAQWTEPATKTDVDAGQVEHFLNRLVDVQVNGFVERPAAPQALGLEPPAGTIEVWTGDEQPQRVAIGSVIEGTTDRYGRIDARNLVVKLPALIQELLDTTPQQLRQAAAPDGDSADDLIPSVLE